MFRIFCLLLLILSCQLIAEDEHFAPSNLGCRALFTTIDIEHYWEAMPVLVDTGLKVTTVEDAIKETQALGSTKEWRLPTIAELDAYVRYVDKQEVQIRNQFKWEYSSTFPDGSWLVMFWATEGFASRPKAGLALFDSRTLEHEPYFLMSQGNGTIREELLTHASAVHPSPFTYTRHAKKSLLQRTENIANKQELFRALQEGIQLLVVGE